MPTSKKRTILVLLLIVTVPAIPAVLVQYLVKERPPGSDRSEIARDVEFALKSLPLPHGEPVSFRYDLSVGRRWTIETSFTSPADGTTSLPEEVAPDTGFREELARRGGRYRFEVTGERDGAWLVRLTATGGADARWLGDGVTLRWSATGKVTLDDYDDDGKGPRDTDARDALLRGCGITILGPFPATCRAFEIFAPPLPTFSFKAADIMSKLEVDLGPDSRPFQGGQLFTGFSADGGGRAQFEYLGYRRRPVSGPHWAGRLEVTLRGRLSAPGRRLELAGGERRIREFFAFRRSETVTGEADHTLVIRQSTPDD